MSWSRHGMAVRALAIVGVVALVTGCSKAGSAEPEGTADQYITALNDKNSKALGDLVDRGESASRKTAFVKAKLDKLGGQDIKVTSIVSGNGTEMSTICTLDLTGTRKGASQYSDVLVLHYSSGRWLLEADIDPSGGTGSEPCHKF